MNKTMKAAAIHQFGGIDRFEIIDVAIPEIDVDEILIRLDFAGLGSWDVFEREGGYGQMLGLVSNFPYILGSEGAGTVARIGAAVKGFKEGNAVFGSGFLNPKGGFYAQYAAESADLVNHRPEHLSPEQAAAISGVGMTALRGIEDVLHLKKDEAITIVGASGGIGHIAVQMAKAKGARVFAIASGSDGAEMVRAQGVISVDGRSDDIIAQAVANGFHRFDAVLLTAHHPQIDAFLKLYAKNARIAFPNGVFPEPTPPAGNTLLNYNADPDADLMRRLAGLLEGRSLRPVVSKVYPLKDVTVAHEALRQHHLGKLVLAIDV